MEFLPKLILAIVVGLGIGVICIPLLEKVVFKNTFMYVLSDGSYHNLIWMTLASFVCYIISYVVISW